MLLKHISQELSFDYINVRMNIDLADPQNISLLRSLQHDPSVSVDVDDATLCYSSEVLNWLFCLPPLKKKKTYLYDEIKKDNWRGGRGER